MLLEQILPDLTPSEMICEKQLQFGKGANYGQVVFLGGGAGSGKGFAISNFMDSSKFKIRDVDEWKRIFIEIDKLKGKYPEIRGLNLRNPADVSKLHDFVDKLGIKDKTLNLLLSDTKAGHLPNLMFDITAKDPSSITKTIPELIKLGYDPKDLHLVWILANFDVALERNAKRERQVDPKMVFKTHAGAALTMTSIFTGANSLLSKTMIDGSATVILNNENETVFWTTDRKGAKGDEDADFAFVRGKGKLATDIGTAKSIDDKGFQIDKKGNRIKLIKDFSKLRMKESGKPLVNDAHMLEILKKWILDNVPKDVHDEILGK